MIKVIEITTNQIYNFFCNCAPVLENFDLFPAIGCISNGRSLFFYLKCFFYLYSLLVPLLIHSVSRKTRPPRTPNSSRVAPRSLIIHLHPHANPASSRHHRDGPNLAQSNFLLPPPHHAMPPLLHPLPPSSLPSRWPPTLARSFSPRFP
jgi:hypothetical protein